MFNKAKVGSKLDAVTPLKSKAASESSGRDELKESALSLLRDRRNEFEALDQDVQHRVAKVAEKALTNSKKKKI
jgi:hypothetical protein